MAKQRKTRKSAYIPPSHEIVNRKERDTTTRTVRGSAPQRGGTTRGGRNYEMAVPSWGRTFRRVPFYFILIFALQYFLSPPELRDASVSERAVAAAGVSALVTVAFIPLMHMMERWQYARWLQRTGRAPAVKQASGDGDEA